MSNPLAHLPAAKQRQLRAIVRLICDMADVERIVLFGSHARGDWVEDRANEYMSDFDILILVASPDLAAADDLWMDCGDGARRLAADTPVTLIAHTIEQVNDQLAQGSPFFRDVLTEGIALYDAGRIEPPKVTALTLAQRHALAQRSFVCYFERAAEVYECFECALAPTTRAKRGPGARYSIAAFTLHQTAETLYKVVLLVFSAALPKTHDLAELERMSARVAPDIGPLIPVDAPDRERLAALLRSAYVDARYSFTFKATSDDLQTLARYVRAMHERAEHACREQLAAFAAAMAARPCF